nr:MAG TPA: hypothetical protein [Caudoviricetes sp.]
MGYAMAQSVNTRSTRRASYSVSVLTINNLC